MYKRSGKSKGRGIRKRPASATRVVARKRKRATGASAADPFPHVFEASPSGLVITRAGDGEILEINAAFCRLVGYSRDELVGRTFEGVGLLTDALDRDFVLRTIRRDGAVRSQERHFRHRTGEDRTALISIEPIKFHGEDCLLSTALDITQSTRTATALAQSEETFRSLFRNLPVAIMHCRLVFEADRPVDYEVLRVNPAFHLMTELGDVEGRRIREFSREPEQQFQASLGRYARIVRTGTPERFESHVEAQDAWFAHTIYSPALGEFVVVMENITQRKRAERATIAGKAKLDAALNAMTDAVFISDASGKFIEFNDAFATFHRFGSRDACAKTLAEHPEFLDVYLSDGTLAPVDRWAVPRALRGETGSSVEYRLRRRDTGETWYGSYSFAPIRDTAGEIIGSIVTGRDVTEQKRLADELLKLSLVVEQSPESIMITGLDGRIEYVNEALVRKSGYSRNELIGRNPRLFASGRTPPATYTALWQALARHETVKCEFHNRRKNGDEYIDFAVINPIRGVDGRVSHFVAVADDITDRKRMDAELELHRHHLEAMVAERTAELAVAKGAAEAAAAAKGAFLATMSHEIRTPLNAVLGAAQLGYRDSADERVRVMFRRILDSGRLLLASVNDVLDLSKIEASKLSLDAVAVAATLVVDETISAMSPAANAKGLRLIGELAADLPEAFLGDPVRIGQILLNLTSNAIRFTEKGEIRLSVRQTADELLFTVSDTGIGIAPEDLQRLFEPFEQVASRASRRFGGTGLGLAISRRLARLMGGEITVTSSPGAGSVFVLTLPLVAAQLSYGASPAPDTGGAGRLKGLRVLAAEDNALNRVVLDDALTGEGAEVTVAENGRVAVELVSGAGAGHFDVVLMDVQMPELDGLEATRRIHDLDPAIPVVGQTAHAHAEEHEACREAGMIEVVTKPLSFDDLVATIRRRARHRSEDE